MTDDCLIPSASSPQGEKFLIEVNSWRPPSLHICSHLTAGYRLSSMVEGIWYRLWSRFPGNHCSKLIGGFLLASKQRVILAPFEPRGGNRACSIIREMKEKQILLSQVTCMYNTTSIGTPL